MRRPCIAFVFICALTVSVLMFGGAARTAQPRMLRILTSNAVRLSDLFDGLEPGQDCDIGPAPAPGKRLFIGEAQLVAIANQFSVAWQPGTAPAQVILEHGVRLVETADYLPQVRAALVTSGAPAEMDIHLFSDGSLRLPIENTGSAEVESVTFEPRSGSFSVGLRFSSAGSAPTLLRIAGVALEMVDLPVLRRTMPAGSVIAANDLQIRRLRRSGLQSRTLLVSTDAIGLALRSQVLAGSPVPLDELRPPVLVARGMAVTLHFQSAGLILTAKGEAIESGSMGDLIHILNPGSKSVLTGRVNGQGAVELDPVIPPIFLTSQQSGMPQPYSLAGITSLIGQRGAGR